jgi:ATP-dependent Clp protease ATP-binding subunit ClpX
MTNVINEMRDFPDAAPAALLDAVERAQKEAAAANIRLHDAATAAHEAGISWAKIGDVLGVTRQAAWERFGKGRS